MNKTINRDKPITGKISASEAGNYYVWKTLGDNRVRSRHAHRDGRIFHRDHPPEGGHPGEDYGCRCQARPVPTYALLPEEFQSDSNSLQYEDLLESGKVDDFNKMVEAGKKLEEVDQKLEKESNRLTEGKKKNPDKLINILKEQEKIQKDAVKKEVKFGEAIESDKTLAKKSEPRKQGIDREFDELLDQHDFGTAYAMIENQYDRTRAFDMLKRKYGLAEAEKLVKKQLDAKVKELAELEKAAKKKPKDKIPARFGAQSALEREEEILQRKREGIKKGIRGIPTPLDALPVDDDVDKKAKESESDKPIDKEFLRLLGQYGFGPSYTMVQSRYGKGPAFDMIKRRYGDVEAGRRHREHFEKPQDSVFPSSLPADAKAHYRRNKLNKPPTFQEARDKWTLRPSEKSGFHRQEPGNKQNLVFISPDGHREAVFRPDGTLVTDPRNMGTYNKVREEDLIGHFKADILPYIHHGNSPDDPSTFWERAKLAEEGFIELAIRNLGKFSGPAIQKVKSIIRDIIAFQERKERAIAAGVSLRKKR